MRTWSAATSRNIATSHRRSATVPLPSPLLLHILQTGFEMKFAVLAALVCYGALAAEGTLPPPFAFAGRKTCSILADCMHTCFCERGWTSALPYCKELRSSAGARVLHQNSLSNAQAQATSTATAVVVQSPPPPPPVFGSYATATAVATALTGSNSNSGAIGSALAQSGAAPFCLSDSGSCSTF